MQDCFDDSLNTYHVKKVPKYNFISATFIICLNICPLLSNVRRAKKALTLRDTTYNCDSIPLKNNKKI